jgi:hypothetical protein
MSVDEVRDAIRDDRARLEIELVLRVGYDAKIDYIPHTKGYKIGGGWSRMRANVRRSKRPFVIIMPGGTSRWRRFETWEALSEAVQAM